MRPYCFPIFYSQKYQIPGRANQELLQVAMQKTGKQQNAKITLIFILTKTGLVFKEHRQLADFRWFCWVWMVTIVNLSERRWDIMKVCLNLVDKLSSDKMLVNYPPFDFLSISTIANFIAKMSINQKDSWFESGSFKSLFRVQRVDRIGLKFPSMGERQSIRIRLFQNVFSAYLIDHIILI